MAAVIFILREVFKRKVSCSLCLFLIVLLAALLKKEKRKGTNSRLVSERDDLENSSHEGISIVKETYSLILI